MTERLQGEVEHEQRHPIIPTRIKRHGAHWDLDPCPTCGMGSAVNLSRDRAGMLLRDHVCYLPEDEREEFTRPTWDEYFAEIAQVTAKRGYCLRAQVGCVIVVDRRIVAGGYNGPPSGEKSCVDGPEFCPCGIDPGSERLGTATVSRSLCPALHAEQNAVAYGGRDCRGGTAYVTKDPCHSCSRLLQAAGVVRVVSPKGESWL